MATALSRREHQIMVVLWDLRSGTVAEVRDRLDDPLAYTTVLSTLRTMEAKGFVRHVEEGRAHRYIPRLKREAVHRGALARLVETVFEGSPDLLLAQLVSDRRLSNDELRRIRDLIDERLPEEER